MDLSQWHLWLKRQGGREIRELLLKQWDPIGVASTPEMRDEYDGYIGHIADSLRRGGSVPQIAGLLTAATDHMGLQSDQDRDARCAQLLVDWYRRAIEREQHPR